MQIDLNVIFDANDPEMDDQKSELAKDIAKINRQFPDEVKLTYEKIQEVKIKFSTDPGGWKFGGPVYIRADKINVAVSGVRGWSGAGSIGMYAPGEVAVIVYDAAWASPRALWAEIVNVTLYTGWFRNVPGIEFLVDLRALRLWTTSAEAGQSELFRMMATCKWNPH